ncbi:hypothetical protein NZK33_05845 [Cyanobium sp. FGCU-6]|jgi:hypothetical protein|nr:hypothetical protein [Cyanobium sp. FGCU6]
MSRLQLQKEIFQRQRKKVPAGGVIETLVESGAKSQSDRGGLASATAAGLDVDRYP